MEFGILGPLLVRDGGREVAVGGARRRALLCALLVRAGHVVPAERLVADLWDEPPAAATLVSHVAHLRRVIGAERVVTRAPGYLLAVDPDAVDAHRFERDLGAARAALRAGDAAGAEELVGQGLALWRGPALADVRYLGWAAGKAARLDELRAAAVEVLLEARLALGRSAEAVAQAEAAVAANPLRERLWALLMVGLYREGRQTEALGAYQRLRSLLTEEVGIEPGPAVRAVQAQVLTQDPVLDLPVPPRSAPGEPAPPSPGDRSAIPLPARLEGDGAAFVGRSGEMDRLLAAATEVAAGEQRLVVVAGEPGAGKTWLCGRLAGRLAGRGWAVAYGRCEEGLPTPYRPWSEALGHMGPHLPQRLVRTHVDEHGTDVVLVAPTLVKTVGRIPPPRAVEGPVQQGLLLDAVAGLLATVAAEHPLLCVLDDVQWADEASLLLLRHLAQGTQRPPVLVLAVCHESALHEDGPLQACVAQLHREAGFGRLTLGGLSVAEVAQLVGRHTPGDRNPVETARHLHRATGGNPFYAVELLRHGWPLDGDEADPGRALGRGVPDGVRASIGARAARLGGGGRRVLEMAAVVGQDFTVGLVASALRATAEEVLDVLHAAERAALVRLLSGERFAFAHGLIRHSLYGDLQPGQRARQHRTVAEMLDALPGAAAADRARHWLAGAPGDVRAMAAAEAAGDAALAAYAYADAVGWYVRAIEELDRGGLADARGRVKLLISLGTTYRLAGRRPDADATLGMAAAAARTLNAPELLAQAALGLAGYDRLAPAVDPQVPALLREALEALGDNHDRLRVALCARLATYLPSGAEEGDLGVVADRATTIAAGLDDPDAQTDALSARLHMLSAPERAAARLEVARLLAVEADRRRDVELSLVALDHELAALVQLGRFDAARTSLARYADTARQVGIPQARAFAAQQEGFFVFAAGDAAAEAQTLARIDEALHAAWHSDLVALGGRVLQLTPLRWLQGRLAELRADTAAVLRFSPSTHAEPALLLLDVADGDVATARARLDGYLTDPGLLAVPRNALWCPPVFQLASAAAAVGTADHARELISALAPCAGLQGTYLAFVYYGSFDHHLGVLQALAGDEQAAVVHLEAALRQHRALPSIPWAALTGHVLGRLLLRTGNSDDRARGKALLRCANDAAATRGMADPMTLTAAALGKLIP